MRVVLTSPTYGMREPKPSSALMVAVMTAGNRGTRWLGDVSPDRMSFADARNHVAEFVTDHLADEADGVVWVDSDIVPAPDSIHRLLTTVEQGGYDFLSGVYHARNGEHRPVFYNVDERGKLRQGVFYEMDKIVEVGAAGFGFVYTSTRLLLAIKALPKPTERTGWFHYGEISEDLYFCQLARQAGFKLYVDTGIQVGHQGAAVTVTRDTYLAALAARSGGQLPKEMK